MLHAQVTRLSSIEGAKREAAAAQTAAEKKCEAALLQVRLSQTPTHTFTPLCVARACRCKS